MFAKIPQLENANLDYHSVSAKYRGIEHEAKSHQLREVFLTKAIER